MQHASSGAHDGTVAELVDARHSKCRAFGHPGSTPGGATTQIRPATRLSASTGADFSPGSSVQPLQVLRLTQWRGDGEMSVDHPSSALASDAVVHGLTWFAAEANANLTKRQRICCRTKRRLVRHIRTALAAEKRTFEDASLQPLRHAVRCATRLMHHSFLAIPLGPVHTPSRHRKRM